MSITRIVGSNAPRKEGPDKLRGTARYVDDHRFPAELHGATLRSTVSHGRILSVRFDPAFPWSECVVVTKDDIPGTNRVRLIEADQPVLADGIVRHRQEPILLVAHPDRATAYEALRHIDVEYEELPALLSTQDALRAEIRLYGEDNVFKTIRIEKGDTAAALAEADFVVEGEYTVPHQEQAYIETNGVAAWAEDGGITVLGSLQCPYYVHKALAPILGLPGEKVRVIQAMTGGGFGGKEEYPNILAAHAALLAWKARRPVKMVYDRHEDMLATTKRHPAVIRHRTGVTREGLLVAQEIDVVMDGGAYITLSPVVLSRGVLHATGPYSCPNVTCTARAVATHTPPNGAFRGFGAPQTLFAAELHWERIAAAVGIDSLTLRRRNIVHEGSVLSTGQRLDESAGAEAVLERCVEESRFEKRRNECERWNRKRTNPTWRGIGLAVVHHGSGFTGSGEVYLASEVSVRITNEGRIRVEAASTEMGQGTTTLFAQIAAETLGLSYEQIEIETPDTAKVPDSGPTVASRTCMIVGGLVRNACRELRTALLAAGDGESQGGDAQDGDAVSGESRREEALRGESRSGALPQTRAGLRSLARKLLSPGETSRRFTARYSPPEGVEWDEEHYRGHAYATYGYAATAVELEVDKLTYEIRVRRLTSANDVGHALHPLFVEGQVMGGSLQALGYALMENAVYADGEMKNAEFTNYILPTACDAPEMAVSLVDRPYARGPFGAKGVGEVPMDVPAPAVAAAILQATGVLVSELPILPETLARGMRVGGTT
ncbi:MAG: xanthine dehydrogenase family protein molybdopterin-binding subunit [Candidatus Eisenbacteria bacterium]